MTETAAIPLQVTQRDDGHGRYAMRLVGDVDLSSLPLFTGPVTLMLAASPTEVSFELGGVRFIDSSGIAVLLQVADAVPVISLRDPSPAVRRIVELSGLATALPMSTGPVTL